MRVEVVLAYFLHTMGLQSFLKKKILSLCHWVFTRDLHFDIHKYSLYRILCSVNAVLVSG